MSIGYYDDFARFFLKIKKEFRTQDSSVDFIYLSLYLSGFLYFITRFQKASFFSLKVWVNKIIRQKEYQNVLSKHTCYKEIDLDEIIKYHKLLGNHDEKTLKLQAISYIDVIEKTLKKTMPDILILSGDSRMSIEIFNIQAKTLGIKTYYFEQGPFGTTIIDTQGVNANASIRDKIVEESNISETEKEQKIKEFFMRRRSLKYKRNPIYRGSDYIFQFLSSKVGLLPIDIMMGKENKLISPQYAHLKSSISEDKKIFLCILQVPHDVNMVYHSPFYKNHFSIVEDVYNNLPKNTQLIVREHPLYKKKYEEELYDFMYKNDIAIDLNDLYKSIDNADVVIVNNSTVGIEAISRLKPVVALGNSYYDNQDICLKLKNKEQLDVLLESSLTHKVKKESVNNFLYAFLYDYLIDGHFRDEKLSSAKRIVQRLLHDI
jgi:capsular polysaccharide export protein